MWILDKISWHLFPTAWPTIRDIYSRQFRLPQKLILICFIFYFYHGASKYTFLPPQTIEIILLTDNHFNHIPPVLSTLARLQDHGLAGLERRLAVRCLMQQGEHSNATVRKLYSQQSLDRE